MNALMVDAKQAASATPCAATPCLPAESRAQIQCAEFRLRQADTDSVQQPGDPPPAFPALEKSTPLACVSGRS